MIKIIESKAKLNQLASNAMKSHKHYKNSDLWLLKSILKVKAW